jgi:hypothetical protein
MKKVNEPRHAGSPFAAAVMQHKVRKMYRGQLPVVFETDFTMEV